MDPFLSTTPAQQISSFSLPRYAQLPDIGLYMEQVLVLLRQTLAPLYPKGETNFVTASMISNYIKQGTLPRPTKKKYTCEHLAYLFFIFLTKQTLSLDDIQRLIFVQQRTYPQPVAYDYFCMEFENMLHAVFTAKPLPDDSVTRETTESKIVRYAVTSIVNKIYVSKYLEALLLNEM